MSGLDPRGSLAAWFRCRLAAPELEIAAITALSGGLVNHVATVDLRRAPSAAIERLLLPPLQGRDTQACRFTG